MQGAVSKTPVPRQLDAGKKQFVECLNQVPSRVQVKDGIVRGNGRIWLYLGEVKPGYEPILFNGRFHLDIAEHASCPVVRVTGYGAAAYAHFYGERLPTVAQWFYAVKTGMTDTTGEVALAAAQRTLPLPIPVMAYKANGYGISGLNANIGEWGRQTPGQSTAPDSKHQTYYVLGGLP